MMDSMVHTSKDLLNEYIGQGKLMQLATVRDAKPWICTVYFVADAELNLYWLSFPERRHSLDIAKNAEVAIAIAIKHDKPVIGVQGEGNAEIVTDKTVVKLMIEQYVAKYDVGQKFYANFMHGTNKHVMYKFTPTNYVLFDEVNFPDDGRQLVDA